MRKISRISFTKKSAIVTAAIAFDPLALQWKKDPDKPGIPLGGHLFSSFNNPDDWIRFAGRGDGENYQAGFLTVGDVPQQEMIDRSRRIGYRMYNIRAAKKH